MTDPHDPQQLEALSDEIFDLTNIIARARAQSRGNKDVETLTETENITLDLLRKAPVMTVGEIQKAVGVLPAQMSRIVRSLEDKNGAAYIECKINAKDRRMIDVSITPKGRKALEAYRKARMAMITTILSVLDHDECDEFMRILRKMRDHISKLSSNK
ncbi:MAG: MarR family transcriptional regulator [Planctomycetes bacterium]|nr:MarR family transcriptional regulator [Planctomycetota bacterium]